MFKKVLSTAILVSVLTGCAMFSSEKAPVPSPSADQQSTDMLFSQQESSPIVESASTYKAESRIVESTVK